MVESVAGRIAETLAQWETRSVEASLFGTADPAAIARLVGAFCAAELGAEIADGLFYESSQGAVFGLRLADGRRVALKAHQPRVPVEYLAAVATVQHHLAGHGFPCPGIVLGPAKLGQGHVMVEQLIDEGAYADAHEPSIRRTMAETLAWLVTLAQGFATLSGLRSGMLHRRRTGALWPPPHSAIFDFEATAGGAEWIDRLARRAQEALARPAGQVVVGHVDWSVKHFRFLWPHAAAASPVRGAGEPPPATVATVAPVVRVVYDWDSLAVDPEPVIVGEAARGFTMTWHLPVPVAPSADEARAFVAEYEAARGRRFGAAERQTMGAAATYAMAYSARCEHALRPDVREFPEGSYRAALARYEDALLGET